MTFSFQTPDESKTKPVRVQIIIVSINGSKIETIPSETGSCARAAECAIGADPCPASFENNPRFTPWLNANAKLAPINPPTAEVPEKTFLNIEINEGIIFS